MSGDVFADDGADAEGVTDAAGRQAIVRGQAIIGRLAIVGRGRLGAALVRALPHAAGPFGRGFDGFGYDTVVLAVPDREITGAAATIINGPLVGHCAGAVGLTTLAPHERFSLHPLLPVSHETTSFAGASAAIAASTPRALEIANELATQLGLRTFEVDDADRAAYHAAASIASNFLVTLEYAAETLLATTGTDRDHLLALVRATVENWAALGGPAALTGPVVRNDVETIARQREAVRARTPEFLELFDVMVERTRALAAMRTPEPIGGDIVDSDVRGGSGDGMCD